jgi:hypothetical protein
MFVTGRRVHYPKRGFNFKGDFFFHCATAASLLVIEVSRSHSDTPHSIGFLGPTQRPVIENKQHSGEADIHDPVGFVPAIPANDRSQILALERAVVRIGKVDKEIM